MCEVYNGMEKAGCYGSGFFASFFPFFLLAGFGGRSPLTGVSAVWYTIETVTGEIILYSLRDYFCSVRLKVTRKVEETSV
jgi:hypothetical protein